MHDSIKTFFEGVHKVCPPAQTCRTALAALEHVEPRILERYAEIVHPSGVPHYRVHGTAAYRRAVGTWRASGKGHSSEQALASGLMELIERYSCYTHLEQAPGSVYGPRTSLDDDVLGLADLELSVYGDRRGEPFSQAELRATPLTWFPALTLDGRRTAVPARLVTYTLQGSNGMASGNTYEEALLHGLLEVIERHCQTHVLLGRRDAPRVDPASVDSDLGRDLLERLERTDGRVVVRDFSLGLGIPVIAAARALDDGRIELTVGSATTREEALIRAITENVQGQGLQNCFTAEEASRFVDESDACIPFDALHDMDDVNIRSELDSLARILRTHDMQAVHMETTAPSLGIPCVMSWVVGTQFHSDDIAHRSMLAGCLYDAQMGGHVETARALAETVLQRDPPNAPAASVTAALNEAAAGDLKAARRALSSLAIDDGVCSAFEARGLRVLRDRALAHIAMALGDGETAQEACLAVIAADETVTADFVALTPPSGVSADAAATTAALFSELRQFWLLDGRPATDVLLPKYRAFLKARAALETDLAAAEQLFGEGRDEEALARARKALERDRLGAEFLQGRWLTGRCLARLGRWDEALAELESMRGLQYDDPRFVMLLELCRKKAGAAT